MECNKAQDAVVSSLPSICFYYTALQLSNYTGEELTPLHQIHGSQHSERGSLPRLKLAHFDALSCHP